MYIILLFCVFAVCPFYTVRAEKKYHNQSEIVDDMVNHLFGCMQELDVNPDICGDLLLKDKDLTDKKYYGCKCIGPCVAKQMGTMDKVSGKWIWTKFNEYTKLMENEALKTEADILQKHCFDETNTHCEAGFAMLQCSLEHSPMAKDMAKNYLTTKQAIAHNDEE